MAVIALMMHTVIKAELQPAPIFPEESSEAVYISLGGKNIQLEESLQNENINESFVGVGYLLNDSWSFQLNYLNSTFDQSARNSLIEYRAVDLVASYQLGKKSNHSYHLNTGFGRKNFLPIQNAEYSDNAFKLGAEYRYQLNPNLFVALAVESDRLLEKEKTNNNISLSLNYIWQGNNNSQPTETNENSTLSQPASQSELIKVAPKDSDYDGVQDLNDLCPNTPLHYLVDSKGCRMFVIDNEMVTLEINFELNSHHVFQHYYSQIESIARFLNKHSHLTLNIEGHTDNSGSQSYNLSLSQKRADEVARILTEKFMIANTRITAQGFGDQSPIASNSNEQGRQKNRRVQAVLSVQVERPKIK